MPEVVEELKRMTDIGFPIAAMSLVGYLKNMVLVVCMGRLGSLELAGGALAIGFTNITGYSVLSGLAMEWWWYEFMTLLAGYLHKPHIALATSAIVIQTTSLMYTLPTSLSASVSTRVGNELGAGQPKKARLAAVVAVGVALVSSLLGLSLTTLGREAWGRIFTEDGEVLELTMAVLPIIGLCELANCPQTTSCGILRGSARPGIGAWINFYSFYMVGAPVAVVMAFVWRLGFQGLCYGLLAAQITCVISILTVVHKTDWEREWLKSREFVGRVTTEWQHFHMQMKQSNVKRVRCKIRTF
ncbi:MATE efflux family protein [Prunus dulcis]|uniref:MATE efflux family protein n=1 Tax=Prunus dulcis TaxID=3755 RepID=A0A4Y1QMS8_PRUDU|nr:MATE efflux family protein [Prunus dulcis]